MNVLIEKKDSVGNITFLVKVNDDPADYDICNTCGGTGQYWIVEGGNLWYYGWQINSCHSCPSCHGFGFWKRKTV